ncbi:MAG: hypothetical protein AAGA83_00285 [Cyanobacteria bacterium P01_F01_bin.116]
MAFLHDDLVYDTLTAIKALAAEKLINRMFYAVQDVDGAGLPGWYLFKENNTTTVDEPAILQPTNKAGRLFLMGSASGGAGNTLRNGSGVPAAELGNDGDFYIDTAANEIYGPKALGTWGSGESIVGPQGSQGTQGDQGVQGIQGVAGNDGNDGNTVLNGSGGPGGGTGIDGDFYIDNDTNEIYGPKTGGAWGAGTSLVGPQGATGATGSAGADGADGADGLITNSYESAETTWAANTTYTFTHGLGQRPDIVQVWLVCKTAEADASVDDWLDVTNCNINFDGSGSGFLYYGVHVYSNATQVKVRVRGSGIAINSTGNNAVTLTPASWRIVVRAWA